MKKVILKDVARDAGVSPAIASFAMNNVKGRVSEKVRKKVLQSAKKLGYVPNTFGRNLKSRKSDTIALVYDESFLEERNASTLQFVAGAVKYGRSKGKDILIKLIDNTRRDSSINEYMELYVSGKVEGIIFYCEVFEQEYYDHYMKRDVNFVVIPNEGQVGDYNAVYLENFLAIKEAVRFISAKGYEEIYYLTRRLDNPNQRELGYLSAKEELGIQGLQLYYESKYRGKGELWEAVREVIENREGKIAITCWNDVDAMNLIDILHSHGIAIPEEVGVMGFDDIPGSENTYPALTTVKQPFEEMAERAIDILLKDDKEEVHRVKVPFEIIERNSI